MKLITYDEGFNLEHRVPGHIHTACSSPGMAATDSESGEQRLQEIEAGERVSGRRV